MGPKTAFMHTISKLQVKGMVCQRCINLVRDAVSEAGLNPGTIQLGEIRFAAEISTDLARELAQKLQPLGFTVLEDKKIKIVLALKALVAEVYSGTYDFPERFRFSLLATQRFALGYDTLSQLFAVAEQKTLERYIIDYRIEKIKELLVYSGKSLNDIAYDLGFSSVAHLSRQFKENTGLNPSRYRQTNRENRALVAG